MPKLDLTQMSLTPTPLRKVNLNKTEMHNKGSEYTPKNFSFYGSNN